MPKPNFSLVPNPDKNFQSQYYLGSKSQHDLIIEIEEIMLCGMIMSAKTDIPIITSIISEHDFFTPSNREIFKGCLAVYKSTGDVCFESLKIHLININKIEFVGGESKIVDILSRAVETLNVEIYAKNLLDKSIRSKLEREGAIITKRTRENFELSTYDLIQEAEDKISNLKKSIKKVDSVDESSSWGTLSSEFVCQVLDGYYDTNSAGFKSGIGELDNAVGGFQPGDFIMLAGPSGIGKTAFGCSLMYYFVKQGISCLFLSGEMPAKQIAARVLSCHSGINSKYLTREYKKLTKAQIDNLFQLASETSQFPMSIKSVGVGTREIQNAIITATSEAIEDKMPNFDGNFKVIFLDYLQLLSGGDDKSENRSLEIDRLAQWCKRYAIENNCVIIAFAQINDDVLKRNGNRIPNIDDIGWCRTAKNHVDYLAFLWSDYYNSIGTSNQINIMPDQEILQIWFRKSRHTGFSGMVETSITRSVCRVTGVNRQSQQF